VNDGKPTTAEVPPGKAVTLRTPITRVADGSVGAVGAADVYVRYQGSRKIVILETSFE
jgi:hypothetical protein